VTQATLWQFKWSEAGPSLPAVALARKPYYTAGQMFIVAPLKKRFYRRKKKDHSFFFARETCTRLHFITINNFKKKTKKS
jgi:hypothetical protein